MSAKSNCPPPPVLQSLTFWPIWVYLPSSTDTHVHTCIFWYLAALPLRLLYANQKDVRLLWTNRKSSENERVIVSTTEAAVAVDFLYTGDEIFWSDFSERKIFSCSLKTSCKPQIIVSGDLGRLEGLAVDWVSKKLYWTDCDFQEICVSSIDGKNRKTLIWNNLDNPRAIAVDPRAG